MRRFGLLLLASVAFGCHPSALAPSARPLPAKLPLTGRGAIEPDVSALSTELAASIPSRPTQYRRLTAPECRSLAARNSPLADDLDSHPANTAPEHPIAHKKAEQSQLSRVVRGFAADELRLRSAADALELYFKLAVAEGQFDLAANTHELLRTQLAAAEKAGKVGLKDGMSADRLRREVLQLESQLGKLEAGIVGLNAALAGTLGLDPNDTTPIWPAETLRVPGEVPDAEQAVATGMHYRPDLNLLRTLTTAENRGGELAEAVLSGVNPLFGNTSPPTVLGTVIAFVKHHPTLAEDITRRQLLALLQSRERQADAEIRAAVATVRGNRAAVAAKAAEVRGLTEQVTDLDKRAKAGLAGAEAELAVARVQLLKVRSELLQAVGEWHIADVKLRQAIGLLVRE